MKQKPGVMIYFELSDVLDVLSDADAGKLFRIILEYGKTMLEPVIPDNLLVAWPLIRSRLFFDNQRYNNLCLQNAYKSYAHWEKEKGRTPLPFDEWLLSKEHPQEFSVS